MGDRGVRLPAVPAVYPAPIGLQRAMGPARQRGFHCTLRLAEYRAPGATRRSGTPLTHKVQAPSAPTRPQAAACCASGQKKPGRAATLSALVAFALDVKPVQWSRDLDTESNVVVSTDRPIVHGGLPHALAGARLALRWSGCATGDASIAARVPRCRKEPQCVGWNLASTCDVGIPCSLSTSSRQAESLPLNTVVQTAPSWTSAAWGSAIHS